LRYLNEGVVENKHDGRSIPSRRTTPEQHLPDITNITYFGMAKAEFPKNKRCVKNKGSNDDSEDNARNETQNRVRVWKRHDS
jgi:hypothetical protein